MKKTIAKIVLMTMLAAPMAAVLPSVSVAATTWDTTGSYVINMNYLGTDYAHDMHLTQSNADTLTGNGGSPAGANTYTWVINSGTVSGNAISFTANYTATADAVTPQTVLTVNGTIANDGTMSGTWSDNYQGGQRSGTWTTVSGMAHQKNNTNDGFVTTNAATSISSSNATLNGTNGGTAATGHSFWVSTSPFSTASSTIPSGVFSTQDMGAIAANTSFSAPLSSLTTNGVPSNMPAITPNTTYYFVAWSLVNGVWHPGQMLSFTTSQTQTSNTVKVTIVKFLDGAIATANSASNNSFAMSSTWNAQNIGSGSGTFSLGPTGFNNSNAYTATTADMSVGASYSTHETFGQGSNTGQVCHPGQNSPTYELMGYSTGNTLAQAQQAAMSNGTPSFTNLQSDKFIIVWNHTCNNSNNNGGIGGNVNDNGTLKVDSITVVKSNATADNTFESGWKYIFHITDPNNEPNIAMKFADWIGANNNTIPVANNMRISSAQANNGGATILLTGANTYTSPLTMTTDLNPSMAGRQVDVTVEVKIPSGTSGGSYSTTYGVQSTP
jgi:hypothetical protein